MVENGIKNKYADTEPALPQQRPTHIRRFPQLWRDFEATSYSPVITIGQVNEEAFEQRMDPPVTQEPAVLARPDMSQPSPHCSSLNKFRVCRVSPTSSPVDVSETRPRMETQAFTIAAAQKIYFFLLLNIPKEYIYMLATPLYIC